MAYSTPISTIDNRIRQLEASLAQFQRVLDWMLEATEPSASEQWRRTARRRAAIASEQYRTMTGGQFDGVA